MMDFGFDQTVIFGSLLAPLQILLVNLLLSADNALVIALACRGLPPEESRKAALFGTIGAIALRIAMGSVALFLIRIPYLRVVAGLLLLVIAIRLTLQRDDEETLAALQAASAPDAEAPAGRQADMLTTIRTIIVADAAMSFDNVVAVAAIAKDSLFYLSFGLILCIPMLIWGSALIRQVLDEHGYLVRLSGAFLGWVAGSIAVSDPMIAPSIEAYAPFLPIAVPLAGAIFVVWQSLILDPDREKSGSLHAS
jgi:YjbE family integral membrane protein